jgi:plasmid stabilization system protein ParE
VYRVRLEAEASDNLRAHYRNLRARGAGSRYPDEWYYGIRAAILDLATSAAHCGLAYEDRYFEETVRQRVHDSYKILFTIRGDPVHVLHIRHQAQDPQELFG